MNSEETARRINAIKNGLLPKEHFLLWLRDMPPFDSAEDCGAWLFGQAADKISQLTGEVASAVRVPLVGQAWRYGEAVVARAQYEVLFLYFLWVRLNVHVVARASAYQEGYLGLVPAFPRVLEQGQLLLKLREALSTVNGATAPPVDPAAEDAIRRCMVLWKAHLDDLRKGAESLKRTVIETQVVVGMIGRHYFAERPMLWKSSSEFLDTQSDEFQALEGLAGLGPPDTPDVDDAKRAIEAQAKRTAQRLVLMAKVDALRRTGKREEARELLMRVNKDEENREAAEALLGLESPGGPRA